jgi:putative endonuclease
MPEIFKENGSSNPRGDLGRRGEKEAIKYLIKKGYSILSTNYNCPFGELDIVARHGESIRFVEVKTRTGGQGIEQAVGPKKQKNLCLSARCYLDREGLTRENYRFMILYVIFPSAHQEGIRIIPLEDPF